MATFDAIITPAANLASRNMTAQLRRQAPVDTGALKRSISVRLVRTPDSIKFVTDYLPYGVYTDLGTGKYFTGKRKAWNEQLTRTKNPKGIGGIAPRFWTSIYGEIRKKIMKELKAAIVTAIKTEIIRTKL